MNCAEVKKDLKNFIELSGSVVEKLIELIEKVEKLIKDCLIVRTTGVSVAAVGTSMVIGGWVAGLVLAVPTFGASLTVPAVLTVAGTGTAIAGQLKLMARQPHHIYWFMVDIFRKPHSGWHRNC